MKLLSAIFCSCCNCFNGSRVSATAPRRISRPLPDRLTYENNQLYKHYYDSRLSAYDGILLLEDIPNRPWIIMVISPALNPIPDYITIRSRLSGEKQVYTVRSTPVQNMYCIKKYREIS